MVAIAELPSLVAERQAARIARSRESWGVAALLAVILVVYLWGLDRNGWANPYYAAAAQAGARDWKAFFFGSLGWNNAITIDKPPLAIWPMAVSVRLFGLSSWSLLVPQALEGTGAVWLVYASVRRAFPAHVAFAAAILCATTPVFFLMSRYNNPEPMMGLLTALGLYFGVRTAHDARWRWYLLMGSSFGLAFLAKQFQAFLSVPALGLTILVFGAGSLTSRILRLASAMAAMVAAGGWWVTIVELIPVSQRPYVGGSVTNSELELMFDYNGVARFVQASGAGTGGSPSSTDGVLSYAGGIARLFDADFAPEGAWLLGTAIAAVLVLLLYRRNLHGQPQRLLAFGAGLWLLSGWLLLSCAGTMARTYYVYSIIIPEALLIPFALRAVWLRSHALIGRLFGVFLVGTTAFMNLRIMQYSDEWNWWGPALVLSVAAAASIMWSTRAGPTATGISWAVTIAALAAAPIATNVLTASHSIHGTQPMSGPIGNDSNSLSRQLQSFVETGQPAWAPHIAYGVSPSPALLSLLSIEGNGRGRWLAATYPAQDAALLQLESDRPVNAIGGWLGLDATPTLSQFQSFVARGDIEFFIDHPSVRAYGVGIQANTIAAWVDSNYQGQVVSDAVVYRLDEAHKK